MIKNKVLYCIWGQLRASNICGPNYKKYLFNDNNCDLIICCNCSTPDEIPTVEKKSLSYGPSLDTYIYSKKTQDIKNEINGNNMNIFKTFIWPPLAKHQENEIVSSNNVYMDGSIQLLYNAYVLKERLKRLDLDVYSHIIIIRSDLYFIQPMIDFNILTSNVFYTFKGQYDGKWFGGLYTISAVIAPPNLVNSFLELHSTSIYKNCSYTYANDFNIESIIAKKILKSNLTFSHININISFFTLDTTEDKCWGAVNGGIYYDNKLNVIYKYPELYTDAIQNINKTIQYENINKVIQVTIL